MCACVCMCLSECVCAFPMCVCSVAACLCMFACAYIGNSATHCVHMYQYTCLEVCALLSLRMSVLARSVVVFKEHPAENG